MGSLQHEDKIFEKQTQKPVFGPLLIKVSHMQMLQQLESC